MSYKILAWLLFFVKMCISKIGIWWFPAVFIQSVYVFVNLIETTARLLVPRACPDGTYKFTLVRSGPTALTVQYFFWFFVWSWVSIWLRWPPKKYGQNKFLNPKMDKMVEIINLQLCLLFLYSAIATYGLASVRPFVRPFVRQRSQNLLIGDIWHILDPFLVKNMRFYIQIRFLTIYFVNVY